MGAVDWSSGIPRGSKAQDAGSKITAWYSDLEFASLRPANTWLSMVPSATTTLTP